MVKYRLIPLLILVAMFIFAGCSQDPFMLRVEGPLLIKPGNQVVINIIATDDVEIVWSLNNPDMGVLAVSAHDPYYAVFTANPYASGKVEVEVTDSIVTKSVELVIADLAVTGSRGFDFARQGGGNVQSPDDRGYGANTVISHWDYGGHWLEWDINAPKTGEYSLVIRYATKRDPHLTKRELKINGNTIIPVLTFKNTGGYAGPFEGTDIADVSQWATAVFTGISLQQGMNVIRLTHIGDEPTDSNGLNLAYLALVNPDFVNIDEEILLHIEESINVQRKLRHW